MTLSEICHPVEEHLKQFHGYYKKQLGTRISLLNIIVQYMTQKQGKQVRPALVFLSANLCGDISNRTFVGASLVELLHNATLVHDDVVDESSRRRGIASINAVWNNKVAVLLGDFLLAKGLLSAIDNNEFEFLKATSHAVRRMSEGELLQIQKSKEADIEEETYFRIISDKTASLISACCEIGAISSDANIDMSQSLSEYGEMVGIAFQIRDDIFDFLGKPNSIGKPIGNDLKEKKFTLPLIYAFKNAGSKEIKEIISQIKDKKLNKMDIKKIRDFVIANGGIDYSKQKAEEYINKAILSLDKFPQSKVKESMVNFARFVTERDK
jgi:octaprenyl-diphosphate synthase